MTHPVMHLEQVSAERPSGLEKSSSSKDALSAVPRTGVASSSAAARRAEITARADPPAAHGSCRPARSARPRAREPLPPPGGEARGTPRMP